MANFPMRNDVPTQPVHRAAHYGDGEKLERILQGNPSLVNARDGRGNTPLHYAVDEGRAGCVKLLLERGAHVNIRNDTDKSPLHLAAASKRPSLEIIRLLIQHGADVNAVNIEGLTPLDIMRQGHAALEDALIHAGGRPGVTRSLASQESRVPMTP